MDTIHCRLSDEHTAIWACACDQPPFNFCSSCLLTHLTSPGSHTPTPLGQTGPYTCGMCKGQVSDAVSVKYPVCLCHVCMDRYKVTGVPEAHFGLHGDIQEAALKVQGEGAQEAARKIQAAAPQVNFKSLVYEKRVELMMHLTNALEDMNSIEEVKQRALTAERQLKSVEEQLEGRRLDVSRLQEEKVLLLQQQSGASQVHVESSLFAKMEELFEKIGHKESRVQDLEARCDKLASDNSLLIHQSATLSETIEKLQGDLTQARAELANQQELKTQVKTLSEEVEKLNSRDFSIQVKESITSLTEHLTKVLSEKMTDFLPLVTQLQADEPWLPEESMDSFLELARTGMASKSIKLASRVCVQISKLVQPGKSMTDFVKTVNKKLAESSEKGTGLMKVLERIHHKITAHESARDMFRGFLELPTTDNILDEAIYLVAGLSEVLDPDELVVFSIAMIQYLGASVDKGKKWLFRLSSFPIKWPEDLKERGVASVRTLMTTVVKSQFNKTCLKLSKVLSSYGQHDPELLLTFTLRACDALLNQSLETDLHSLFKKMDSYIKSTAKYPEQASHRLIEKSFLSMKLLLPGASATKDQLELLKYVLSAMESGTEASQVLDSLLAALQSIKDWESSLLLGFALLDWMFDRTGKERVEFTGHLLQWFMASDPRGDVKESVQLAVSFLSALKSLSQALNIKEIKGLEGLMDSGVEFPKARALIVSLTTVLNKRKVPAKISQFIANLLSILDPGSPDARSEIADRYTAVLQNEALFDEVLATSECHALLQHRNYASGDALHFVIDVLERLVPGGDNSDLDSLLKELTSVLSQEGQTYTAVFKSCEVYVGGKYRLPMDSRPLTLCTFVLKRLQQGDDSASIENFLKEFVSTLAQDKVLYSVAFELGQLYTKDITNTAAASEFLREGLVLLRDLPAEGELEALLQDIQAITALTPKEVIAFIQIIFQLCAAKPAQLATLTRTLRNLLGQAETVPLVKVIQYIGEAGDKGKKLLSRLSSLQIQWRADLKERGLASMRTLMATVVKSQFNKPCLKLSKVLSSYGQHDPELLLAFTVRACNTLLNKTLEQELHSLFKKMASYIQFTANFTANVSTKLIEKSFLTMKLLLPDAKATKDQLELLTSVLSAMESQTKTSQVLDLLLGALQAIKDWNSALVLGFAVLEWMFARKRGERVEFAGHLLQWFMASDPSAVNENVQLSVTLLRSLKSLSQALSIKEIEGLEGLMGSGIEFSKARILIVALATVLNQDQVPAKISEFTNNLLSILEPGQPDVRSQVADRYAAVIQNQTLFDAVLAIAKCHALLKRRGRASDDALRFMEGVLGRLVPGGDNSDLYSLLKEMMSVLSQERQAYAVVFKSCDVYVGGKVRLPMDSRPITFCTFVLKRLQSGDDPASIEHFLTELISTLAQDKTSHSVAFELGQLYTKYITNTATASEFLREELVVLRNLPSVGELETLLQDIDNLVALTPKEAIAFVKIVFQMCTDKPAEIAALTRTLKTLVGQAETVQLVKDIVFSNFDVRDLIDVVRTQPTAEVITVASLLVLRIRAIIERGTHLPRLSQAWMNVLIQSASDLRQLLTLIEPMLRQDDRRSDTFALQLLDELPKQDHGLVCFAPELLNELAVTLGNAQIAIEFYQNVIVKCFTDKNIDLLTKIKKEPRDKLVNLLTRTQGQVTLQEVEALYVLPVAAAPVLPVQIADPTLPNVQSDAMRFFDFQRNSWGNPIAINPPIFANNFSSYTFLGGDEVFCCGGG